MRQPPILMYHWFRRCSELSQSRSPQFEITPELFERQMTCLRRRGYESVSLSEMFGGGALPQKPIVITFDDGALDFWEFGRPILQACGFTATLFVVTQYVGTESSWEADVGEPPRPLMDWDQLRALAAAGYEIGSHTHTHRELPRLTDDEVAGELRESQAILEAELGATPTWLAYPRGRYSSSHKAAAATAGYHGACAIALKYRDLGYGDRYELKRMTIKGTESMTRFRLRLLAAHFVRYNDSVDHGLQSID